MSSAGLMVGGCVPTTGWASGVKIRWPLLIGLGSGFPPSNRSLPACQRLRVVLTSVLTGAAGKEVVPPDDACKKDWIF